MPRPAKPTRPRSKPILIRLTPAEHTELSRAASASSLPLGTWMRILSLAAARETDPRALASQVIGAARVIRSER